MTAEGKPLEKLVVDVTAPADPVAAQCATFSETGPYVARRHAGRLRVPVRKGPGGASNPVFLLFADAPVVADNFANDTPEKAQEIAVPCDLAGVLAKRGERDHYSFTAKKGDTFTIEALSNRLGASGDLQVSVRNLTGKDPVEMVLLDDDVLNLNITALYTPSPDPAPYRFVAPADGKYQIIVSSHFGEMRRPGPPRPTASASAAT